MVQHWRLLDLEKIEDVSFLLGKRIKGNAP